MRDEIGKEKKSNRKESKINSNKKNGPHLK
jgi:hypothetical protein